MPVPAGVIHASEALKRFVRWKEEEAIGGSSKFGTRRRTETVTTTKDRWCMRVDLRQPVPGDGRASTALGLSPFHLEVTTLTKGAGAVSKPRSGSHTNGDRGVQNGAVAHEIYLSDGLDVVATRGSDFERYLGDGGATHDLAAEASTETRVTQILSNIGDTLATRTAFWKEVEACERTPSKMRLKVAPDRDDSFDLDAIIGDPAAPAELREACLLYRDDLSKFRAMAERGKVLHVLMEDDQDIAWALANQRRFRARRLPAGKPDPTRHAGDASPGRDNKSRRAIHLVKPRGGELQMRLVAELPHELSPDQLHELATAFYERMLELGIPMTLVVHLPDVNNDRRGWHLHLIAYRRRCIRRDDGSWDPTSGRKLRPGELGTQFGDMPFTSAHKELAGADIDRLRALYATLANDALKSAGRSPRLFPGSYADLDIDQEPQEHLGTAASALAKAGVSVATDRANAQKFWAARERELVGDLAAQRNAAFHRLQEHQAGATAVGLQHDPEFIQMLASLEDAAANALELKEAGARHALELAMARSAAKRLVKNTDRLLVGIRNGTARPADVHNAHYIERRNDWAKAHLLQIDEATEPFVGDLAQLAQQERALSDEARQMSVALDDLIAARVCTLEQAAEDKARHASAAPVSGSLQRAAPPETAKTGGTDIPEQRTADLVAEAMQQKLKDWRNGSIVAEVCDMPLSPDEHFSWLVALAQTTSSSSSRLHVWAAEPEFTFQGLKALDTELLRNESRERIVSSFAAAAADQGRAVDRLLEHVRAHGADGLSSPDRVAAQKPPSEIVDLHTHFQQHPAFKAGIEDAKVDYSLSLNPSALDRAGQTKHEELLREQAEMRTNFQEPSYTVALQAESPLPQVPGPTSSTIQQNLVAPASARLKDQEVSASVRQTPVAETPVVPKITQAKTALPTNAAEDLTSANPSAVQTDEAAPRDVPSTAQGMSAEPKIQASSTKPAKPTKVARYLFDIANEHLDDMHQRAFGQAGPDPEPARIRQSADSLSGIGHITKMKTVQQDQDSTRIRFRTATQAIRPDYSDVAEPKVSGDIRSDLPHRAARTEEEASPTRGPMSPDSKGVTPDLRTPANPEEGATDARDPVMHIADAIRPQASERAQRIEPSEAVQREPHRQADNNEPSAELDAGSTPTSQPPPSPKPLLQWDQLFERIRKERLTIVRGDPKLGEPAFSIPSLSPADANILHHEHFASRTDARLAKLCTYQELEVNRLRVWIEKVGVDPGKLILNGRRVGLRQVDKVIVTLLQNWRHHPLIIKGLEKELARREQLSVSQSATQTLPLADKADPERERRRTEAAELYPRSVVATTREVRHLLEVLRGGGPDEAIRAAATKVAEVPTAVLEVGSLMPALKKAYEAAVSNDDDAYDAMLYAAYNKSKSFGKT